MNMLIFIFSKQTIELDAQKQKVWSIFFKENFKRNIFVKKNSLIKLNNLTTISNDNLNELTAMVLPHLYTSQLAQTKKTSIEVNYIKKNASFIDTQQSIKDCEITISSLCDLFSTDCTHRIISQQVDRKITLKKIKMI